MGSDSEDMIIIVIKNRQKIADTEAKGELLSRDEFFSFLCHPLRNRLVLLEL